MAESLLTERVTAQTGMVFILKTVGHRNPYNLCGRLYVYD